MKGPLGGILRCVDWIGAAENRLRTTATPTAIATGLPIADVAVGALSAVGLAAAEIHRRRTGIAQDVFVDRRAASLAMTASDYLRVDGRNAKAGVWDPVTGFYPAEDGRYIYLHANFPHLRDRLLSLLGAENDREAVAAAVARRAAQEIEDGAAAAGACAVRYRDREDWRRSAQGTAAAAEPLIRITRIAGAPPEAPPPGARPLSGVRVLDLTRVIAGPMCGRTLAEHGATVMRIGAPHLPTVEPLTIDTGFGKLSANVDLRHGAGRRTLSGLAGAADVVVDSYRPGALAARGFGPAQFAELRPGVVHVSISAFSRAGPWRDRRGYDTLVQAASGLAPAGADGVPHRLPCQPLDYLTGYLAAFGAMAALMRRADEGGSWQVELSLARTAHWLWEMRDALGPEPAPPPANPDDEAVRDLMMETPSPFGVLRSLRPAVTLSRTPGGWDRPPVPVGSDPPAWP